MPRLLANVPQAHRPPRQAKAGVPPGQGALPGTVGQSAFVATDEQRAEIKKLVACGFNQQSIAVITSIPHATLERHFRFELQHGKTLIDARILTGIIDQALDGDRTMSIFYARARGGWKQSDDGTNANAQTVFSINISNGSQQQPDIGHQITIHSLPQPEDEA